MTNEQINAAIHEALGKPLGCPRECLDPDCPYNQGLNYCSDLNAMHEAEKTLNAERWQLYAAFLFKATSRPQHATARQRAEAFLRALGKWEEAK